MVYTSMITFSCDPFHATLRSGIHQLMMTLPPSVLEFCSSLTMAWWNARPCCLLPPEKWHSKSRR
ncbi:unnamed protein product [Musa hybrid cultivar]